MSSLLAVRMPVLWDWRRAWIFWSAAFRWERERAPRIREEDFERLARMDSCVEVPFVDILAVESLAREDEKAEKLVAARVK
jgi:hypothetical protein